MTKTNKKQKNLTNPVEPQEHLSQRTGNVGELQINKSYAVGDTMRYDGKAVKVVEVLEANIHVKNQQAPFDSFLISRTELDFMEMPSVGMEVIKEDTAPDLMVREDKPVNL